MGREVSALESLQEYLRYLIEGGVEEIPVPPAPQGAAQVDRYLQQGDVSERATRLKEIRDELGECTRCPLWRTRQKIVFGEGNPCADIVFVGEAPGSEEDQTGRPFVGKAGQLLNQIIENGMGLLRADLYIGNILKCRPPLNRTPREEEVEVCLPFLKKQIEAINPKVIVTLGLPAARALLGVQEPMHRIRGNWKVFQGIPVMPTYHPAYVLRYYTVPIRRQVWQDVKEVIRFLEAAGHRTD